MNEGKQTAGAAEQPPVNSLFRALRQAKVDPDLAHEASEEVRGMAGRDAAARRSRVRLRA